LQIKPDGAQVGVLFLIFTNPHTRRPGWALF